MTINPIPAENRLRSPLKSYLMLMKPGIIMGNSITAAAGFAMASQSSLNGQLFVATLIGLGLIIGSACVFNNYIDRYADEKMARTKNRPLVKGFISTTNAIRFGLILGFSGIALLTYFTNLVALSAALIGFSIYLFLYSFWKYKTVHGTLIGSIAGAMPPVVGYTAVTESLDLGAFLLFLLVALWQMPHFFAIAMYRLDDYKAASIPVLPAIKGMHETKVQMLFYTAAFGLAAILPSIFHFTHTLYFVVSASISIGWLALSIQGFWADNDKAWARKMFLFSLVAIMSLSLFLGLDAR